MKKLSNQTIRKLTKFTHVMRREFGSLKTADLIADNGPACGYLFQGALSEDNEVKYISRELVEELNLDINLLIATETYINYLTKQNLNPEFIHQCKYFIVKFAEYLYGIDCNSSAYRHAVKGLLNSSDKKEKAFCINLAKSFYPYWKKAYIAKVESNKMLGDALEYDSKKFNDLWRKSDEIFLSASEDWTLSSYSNAMLAVGTSEKEIDTRKKFAKLILNESRSYSQTNEPYRLAVDNIHSYLLNDEMKKYFLVVSREFYKFWKETMVVLEGSKQ
ncbi:MAG TPA: hypothetical protein VLM20_05800 [Methylophilaceae bacterium]|nr:hypothetical protein [Methylophilaceae bacterium]